MNTSGEWFLFPGSRQNFVKDSLAEGKNSRSRHVYAKDMFRNHFTMLLLGLLAIAASPARAQIGLPPVQVPNLPVLDTQPLNRTVNGVLDQADPQQLRELRKLRIRSLLRANRAALETDPRGAPIVRNEVVALSPTQEALDQARAAGFGIGRTRTLEGLDVTIVVLQAPAGMSTRRALDRLRQADPEGTYDYNHIYLGSGEVTAAPPTPGQEVNATAAAVPPAATGIKIGLIDGGVQRSHPVFTGVTIHEHGCAGGNIPNPHGTAVASLLVGQSTDFHGAVPGAELFSADVYCDLAAGGAVDLVAEAFSWLAKEKVPVINISLVGPPNSLIERIVKVVIKKGHIVVAAVGNDGPSAPPLYPASYPNVIAVTGVDARRRVLVEACRGDHVDFSAPGSNMSAAGIETPFAKVRGTSFASPIVAGLLARNITAPGKEQAASAVAALVAQATDLGAKGTDKVYGNGLVGDDLRMSEKLAAAPRQ
jgi:subtilisin family serine protease